MRGGQCRLVELNRARSRGGGCGSGGSEPGREAFRRGWGAAAAPGGGFLLLHSSGTPEGSKGEPRAWGLRLLPPCPLPFPPVPPSHPPPSRDPVPAGRCTELRGGRRRYKSPSPRLLCFPRSYKTGGGVLVTLTFRDLYDAFISLPSAMGCGQGSALILASSLSVSRSEQIPGSADSEDSSWGPTVCGCLSLSIIKDSCQLFPINSSAPSCARIWRLPRDAFGTEP